MNQKKAAGKSTVSEIQDQVNTDSQEEFYTFPLSFQQEALWFLDQLEPGLPVYNLLLCFKAKGDLKVPVLAEAIDFMVNRHEVLRTGFGKIDGELRQIIYKDIKVTIDYQEISKQVPNALDEAMQMARDHATLGFDLTDKSLFRPIVIKYGEDQYLLLFILHHIIFDGWSSGIFLSELGSVYNALLHAKEIDLEPTAIQYADYSVWQRKWFEQGELKRQLKFWKENLGGELEPLELPTDFPRPPRQNFKGDVRWMSISLNTLNGLKQLSSTHHCTLYMTLLCAFKVLLKRYSGQDDITVGSPMANRDSSELESSIGYYVNTVVFRSDLTDNPTFIDLLKRCRSSILDAFEHREMPLDKLVEELKPTRDLSRNPLFQVMLALQSVPSREVEFDGISLDPVKLETKTSKFDLSFLLKETENGADGVVEFNTELFESGTIDRMIENFQILLDEIALDPNQHIESISILPEGEKSFLLKDINDTKNTYPKEVCIHQWFENQVGFHPDHIAILYKQQSITYKDLNIKANQLAHYLLQIGAKPDQIIGICVDRSIEMVAGLLAILKSGSAYLPLDPMFPKDRLQYMLEDTSSSILVTTRDLADTFPNYQGEMVFIDDWSSIETQPGHNPSISFSSEQLAYVIYTSGSTGKPKGVQVEHKNAVNMLSSVQVTPGLVQEDILLSVTTLSFDISVLEIFLPLVTGARLVLVSKQVSMDGKALLAEIEKRSVTVLQGTPATYRLMVEAGWQQTPKLKILCGGEPIPRDLATKMIDKSASMWNGYGPTEATVYATFKHVENREGKVTIGKPVNNTQVYILDKHLQLVPRGVVGELHIGGDGLARGYLNRPELNEEKFISNPFDPSSNSKIYKTGDYARILANGELECLGRIDYQVKVRGFRIELGEIETSLKSHATVHDAIVSVQSAEGLAPRLVGYIIPENGEIDTAEIKSHLQKDLPDYMIPGIYMTLESFPLTPNGKIDRRSLPDPDGASVETADYQEARDEVESQLVEMWESLLGVTGVGVIDGFFDLGGHSLLAAQLLMRIEKQFGKAIPLVTLFESPTIEHLAKIIKEESGAGVLDAQETSAVREPIVPGQSVLGNVPPSFQQEALWFLDQLEPGLAVYNIPICFRAEGELNVKALKESMELMVDRHESLRTGFREIDGELKQIIGSNVDLYFDFHNISDQPQNTLAAAKDLANEYAGKGFDLKAESLLKSVVIKYGEQQHLVLFLLHHIIFDGWSFGVFLSEIASVYNALANDKKIELGPPPIQYADYTVWQRSWFDEDEEERQLKYWRTKLGDNLPPLELSTDFPRPARQSFKGDRLPIEFTPELRNKLKELSKQTGCTLYMTILCAFNVLLKRYSGQDDITIGSPLANRSTQQLENSIGYFVNTVVFRSDLSGDPTFVEFLNRNKSSILDAFKHQEMPLDKLVEELKPVRDLSRNPLFQVMLVLQSMPLVESSFDGIKMNPERLATGTSKFDLYLELKENEQGIKGSLEYNCDLFEGATIERMITNFGILLEQITTNPDQTIGNIPLLSPREQQFLMEEVNHTFSEYPEEMCLHHWFESQAASTPHKVAIQFKETSISYGELNQRANQLAHHLISQGVGPDQLVGLCVDRGIEMVIGLLGILKSGSAYLPMDPAFPKDRLLYMLEDASSSVLITTQNLKDTFPDYEGNLVLLDQDWGVIEQRAHNTPLTEVSTSNLAYVIYTSGSTGKPKGVQLEHGNVVNFLHSMQKEPGLEASDVLLSVTTLSFDIAVLEIFLPLVTGATLVLVDKQTTLDGKALVKELSTRDVTVMQATPATWRLMIDAGWDKTPNLKILCGGEAMPRDLATQLLDKGGSLWNEYGPTETTIWSTLQKVENRQGVIAIGRPIANTQIYILDSQLQLVPRGAIGELHIGGDGLARGYLNREELTAERFITNPFDVTGSSRIYKTGDYARILRNGEIECLGRMDYQVKVRGFRIELGEIETSLKSHSSVHDAVVSVQGVGGPAARLVGYIIPENGEIDSGDIKAFLQKELPDYMIPGIYMTVDSFPLTPNGKIDRKSLPEPDGVPAESVDYQPATSELESQLVEMWESLLGVKRVGVTDGFFDLGGHSLLAAQLFLRIDKKFGKSLPLASLFESPTIKHQAKMIESNNGKSSWPSLVPVQPKGSSPPLFLVHGAEGNVLLYRELAQILNRYDQPVYALQSQGLDGRSSFIPQMEEMAQHYVDEIIKKFPDGPYFLGGYCLGGTIAFEMARQLQKMGKQVGPVIMLESYNIQSIDFSKRTRLSVLYNKFQNLLYHFENLMKANNKSKFFLIKYQAERARFSVALDRLKERFKNGFKKVSDSDYIHLKIAELNDKAQLAYKPTGFDGKIVLIKPDKFFKGLDDPQFGWQGLASQGVELRKLPISPRGMLVEPFAEMLAKEINEAIETPAKTLHF
ncbi:MAG: amino acid adenylation domain-containing protein [Cyclobacteriaceae bacterium]